MSPKKSSSKKSKTSKPYIPRQGTLPAQIFGWLVQRPMLFAELTDHGRRETKLVGEELGSQLSAALYDLCKRGAVIRIDPSSRQIVPSKGARGAFYGLSADAKKHFKESSSRDGLNGKGHAAADSKQLDLSQFSQFSGSMHAALGNKPERMPPEIYSALSGKRAEAEKQIAAIDAILLIWN